MQTEQLKTQEAAAVGWNRWLDGNPPKDGTPIAAIGRVIWSDEYSTSVDSFVALIRWEKDQSGYEGWHFDKDGMTVIRTLDDEVMVDWWLPLPSNGPDQGRRAGDSKTL